MDSGPLVTDGVVYVGSRDRNLYALDQETGSLLWSLKVGGEIAGSILVVGDTVYVASLDHKLYAIDTWRRDIKWVFETGNRLWSGPAATDEVVYVGSEDNSVYAVHALTGEIAWEYETGGPVNGATVLHNGALLFTSYDDYLYSLDASSGELIWRSGLASGSLTRPVVGNGAVYIGAFDGRVYAFDVETGWPLWTYWVGEDIWSSPTVYDTTVLVGADDGRMYALDASGGTLLWSFSTGEAIRSSPAVGDGLAYFGSGDNRIYAVEVSSGALAWRFDTNDDVSGDPLVVGDTVYIGSNDAALYALAAGISEDSTLSLASTLVPTPSLEFEPLDAEQAREVLRRIANRPGLGGKRTTPDGTSIISTVDEGFQVFETGHFLLTGAISNWIPRVLTMTEYFDRVRHKGIAHSIAFCCERTAEGLELIIDGSEPSQRVIGSIGHEAGHARQRVLNPGQRGSANLSALHEAQAFAFQAALIRKLGEYTGINATMLPGNYLLNDWVDGMISDAISHIEDPEEEHKRGRAILWGAVLSDPDLSELKGQLESDRILSPESLLQLHDHLVYIQRDDADEYVAKALEAFTRKTQQVRDAIMGRRAAISEEGFFEHNHGTFLIP